MDFERSGTRSRAAFRSSLSRRDFLKLGGAGLAGAALLGLSGCGSGGGGDQGSGTGGGGEHNFRLAETHPDGYPTTLADERFAELVRERSDGRINIEVFPNAQLGEEKGVLEQVQLGSIAFTRTSASPLAEFSDSMGVYNLPYIFDSDEHLWNFLKSEAGQNQLGSVENARMVGLAYYSSGARSFYTAEREVQGPEDMQGLKIRVQQSQINVDLMNALGASATPMAFGEVYSSLQTGVIDGAENNWPSYESTDHYQVAPNYTLDEHTRVPEVLLASQQAWNQLSADDQEMIRQAAKDSVSFQREAWNERVEQSKETVRSAGNIIIEIPDKTPWQEAVQPMLENYRDQYGDILDQIQQARP